MDFMTVFWIVWMLILPILGLSLSLLIPVFWWFIVPKVARMLTWKRFQKVSFHMVADDTGYAYLIPTKSSLPEGIEEVKEGYRFLPQPIAWANPPSEEDKTVEALLLRKFVWKDMGKPLWFGHAGHVCSVNATALALTQQSNNPHQVANPIALVEKLENYAKDLPKSFTFKRFRNEKSFDLRGDLTNIAKQLRTQLNLKPYIPLDPTRALQLIPWNFTVSQISGYGRNREDYGAKRVGKEYGRLILGGGLILGLVIIAILLVVSLK